MNELMPCEKPFQAFISGFKSEHYRKRSRLRTVHHHQMYSFHQGAEAGGHGRAHDGMGLMKFLPEVKDVLRDSNILLFAAGGISDGQGIAATLALGADGVALGTRFLASTEARIQKGYQAEIVRATDGAKSTKRMTLHNQLRSANWPDRYAPRGIVNRKWEDHQAGVPYEELKKLHDVAEKAEDEGWGIEGRLATYAGAGIGLINDVKVSDRTS